MIDYEFYTDLAVKKAVELLSVDSPSGFTAKAGEYVFNNFSEMGFETSYTNKGSVLVSINSDSPSSEGAVIFEAHTDTLGAMVSHITSEGRLMLSKIGGLNASNTETENVKVYTRDNRVYDGTIQLQNASAHVNKELSSTERSFDTVEVVLDEDVSSDKDVRALGITSGCFVCPSPRTVVTESGYIKSRYLDDKLSVACLMSFAKMISDGIIAPTRNIYILVTVYEEVGHGGSSGIPADVSEAVSVDMGCVGENLDCTERKVSICAKDSGGPYDYDITNRLIAAAVKENADYSVDVYPYYGSDVEATLRAGYDVRHGLIGPGVYASHGYERSHREGVKNTIKVLKGFCCK